MQSGCDNDYKSYRYLEITKMITGKVWLHSDLERK